jgi:hypothetical protein
MAGLFLVRSNDSAFAASAIEQARDQFTRHGFAPGRDLGFPGWQLMHFDYIAGGPETFFASGDDFVAVAGTLSFDGLMGAPALARLLESLDAPALDWSRLGGHFTALVRKGGRAFLFTDYFAAFQLFHDTELRVFSTSLLAAAKALSRLRFDPQGIYEFAFNVMPIGDDTVFEQLKTLGPRVAVELAEGGAILHALAKPLPAVEQGVPMEERLRRSADRLAEVARTHAARFGDKVNCPLSGGIDSRLGLAVLRGAGVQPHVYVYGSEASADVRLARAIGEAEGFPVEWIDKTRPLPDPDGFAAQVERNFHEFDALPPFGNIFDNGGNAAARDARHAGGALAVSGGCGEIYRNFFFLPNRPLPVQAVIDSFFARFAPGDAAEGFDGRAFLRRIRDKTQAEMGLPPEQGVVPRAQLEQIYPRTRCRALFGREISLEARYGAYMMPFLDHHVVAEAMTLPVPLKRAGAFQSALLNAIDPALARHMSAYGCDFAGPPGMQWRKREWATRVRPIWLRRHSYAIQRRLGPMGDEHGGALQRDYLARLVDLEFPAMRRFFHVDRIGDAGLWRRILCLEYLAGHLGGRIAN